MKYDGGGFLVWQRQIGTVTLQVLRTKAKSARGI
jgi:hypothetical protein